MTSQSNSSQSTHPTGGVLWDELLVLSGFHSQLRAEEWNVCALPVCVGDTSGSRSLNHFHLPQSGSLPYI